MENNGLLMEDDREKIFAAVRKGLHGQEKFEARRDSRSPLLSPIPPDFDSALSRFSRELKRIGGQAEILNTRESITAFVAGNINDGTAVFVYDEVRDIVQPSLSAIPKLTKTTFSSELNPGYDKRDVSIFDAVFAPCVACVAETGTVVLRTEARLPAALATKLFIISHPDQLVPSLDEIFTEKFSNFSGSNLFFITGPSRTADIEKELVTGVHGPKEVYVVFIQSEVTFV